MPKTLLLADDSVTIQKVVGISFANEDVVLLTVDNGDDAIARAREARPDLVLADVMMPGKDGYEVCEALKADPELRHVPVLLLSGTFEPYDEERARRAGADGHITKPFEAQALVDQVNALLARPAPSPAAPSGDATVVVAPGDEDAADSAFDFFEEEMAMAQTAPTPKVAALAPPPTALAPADDEPLELETAVEDDEPALRPAPEPFDAGRADDSQATVLFDDGPPGATRRSGTPPPFLGDGFDPEALAAPELPAAPAAPHAPAPAGYEESFDFGFDDGAATATTLATALPAAPPPPPPPPSAPPPVEAATELFGDDEPEPFDVEAVPAPAALPTPPPFAAAPPPVPPSFEPAPPPVPASAASEPLAVRVSGPPAAVALSEPIQQQLQQTLEKIVWEAFGDLTERIVRDVIERVEAVAWEVLPQMAETLIREEIRRLKDGDE